VWAEKRPHEWLGGALGVLGLAPSARNSQINQKVLKGGIDPEDWYIFPERYMKEKNVKIIFFIFYLQ
jgi:hypothetical protein